MTTYTSYPNISATKYNWSDASAWVGGVVPNGSDADVILPIIFSTTGIYSYDVIINAGERYAARSLNNDGALLEIDGTLDISGTLRGLVEMLGGTLNVGTLILDGFALDASGSIRSENAVSDSSSRITGLAPAAEPNGLVLNFGGFTNTILGTVGGHVTVETTRGDFTNIGTLQQGVTIDAPSGGFTNFSNGTLTGGTYETTSYAQPGPMKFNVGGLITTDAATIKVQNAGAGIESYDSATGTYLPLQQTLKTIAPTGALIVDTYSTSNLIVEGRLTLEGPANSPVFTASQLTVAAGGRVEGVGTINGPITNDGLIVVQATTLPSLEGNSPPLMVINGAVRGSGILEVGPAQAVFSNHITPTLELNAPVSTTVTFADRYGVLKIDQPSTFTGTIAPGHFGDVINLPGIGLESITGYAYTGDSNGGVLTLNESDGSSCNLRFAGNYNTASFVLSSGPQVLSNAPPSLSITLNDVEFGNVFYVDGRDGYQTFTGTGYPNFIDTSNAYGIEYSRYGLDHPDAVIVDLAAGGVAKYSNTDAFFTNVQGVQAGADSTLITGLNSGVDLIYGGAGRLEFYGRGATDYIKGGTGTNNIVGGSGNAIFYGNGGIDTMLGGTEANFMQAGATSSSMDVFYGNGGADFVYGGPGTTVLIGGSGTEHLTGGSGFNKLVGSSQTAGINILTGGSGTDVFLGGIGTNLLYAAGGSDFFQGSLGTDIIYGGSGKSFVYGGSGTDVVTTGAGNQYVQAGSGRTFFNDTAANLTAGRFDRIDNFAGGKGTNLYLPASLQSATSFVAQNGGTAVLTAVSGGTAEIFAAGVDVATVQAHTHFTL